MKLLEENLTQIQKLSHGYFLAKKHFVGDYKREVFLTVFDLKLNRSCYGYLFISENSVLLTLMKDLSDKKGVHEIEADDQLSIVDDEISLSKIINSDSGGEKYGKVSTLNEICFINLNNQYILLINIQSKRIYYPTIMSGAYSVKYLTQKDYILKVKNLLVLIDGIIHKKQADFNLPTHGLSAIVSIVNIYVGVTIILIVLGVFMFSFML